MLFGVLGNLCLFVIAGGIGWLIFNAANEEDEKEAYCDYEEIVDNAA